ncbi:MAG: HAD family hydrolase [Candidatus Woesearchaeota archaeon]
MADWFFDFGGLLFDITFNQQTSDRAHAMAQQYLRQEGLSYTNEQLRDQWTQAIKLYVKDRKHSIEWPLPRIVKQAYGLDDKLTDALTDIYRLNDHDYEIFPQTEQVLRALAGKYPLHIISDCPHDSIMPKLKQYNLQDLFQTITMSYEVGYRKPHPAIYLEALRRANVKPEKSVYVSHDFDRDLSGAALAGMDTKHVQPEHLEDLLK